VVIVSTPAGPVKDNEVGIDTFGDSDDAESTTTSAVGRATDHLIHFVVGRIDCTRETVAAFTITFDLHTPLWHFVFERCCSLQIDRVPTKLDEGLATVINIGACHIGRPIPNRAVFAAPDTSFLASGSGWIDIVATQP